MKYKSLKGSHPYLYGIRGVYFIWHGEWADPEVSYKGMTVNYYDVEGSLFGTYIDLGSDGDFKYWAKRNSKLVKETITDLWTQSTNSKR